MNNRSNDELARLLYHSPTKATQPAGLKPATEARPSGRVDKLSDPPWSTGPRFTARPLPVLDENALFEALARGTKANLGRLPSVDEAMALKEQVEGAVQLLRSLEQTIQSGSGVYVEAGRVVFTEQASVTAHAA
jgi:hypothetical protein